jgi:hypothetical protein
MVMGTSQLPSRDVPLIFMGANQISYFDKVKNLGIIMNQDLTWNDHVAKICRNALFTLKRLWTTASFTPIETRRKLVTALIIPQFLYGDIIFSKTSAGLRERLKMTLNSCARYIYGISRRQHISIFTNKILGAPLDVYYSLRMCCSMFTLINSGRPGYLFDELQFGRSRRLFNIIVPAHRTAARASSFFVQGAIIWNGLPSEVRRVGSIGKFREGCLSHLLRSAGSSSSNNNDNNIGF